MRNLLRSIFNPFLGLLFPPSCLACEQTLCHGEQYLCTVCWASFPQRLTMWEDQDDMAARLWGSMPLIKATSLFTFQKGSPVQQLIYKIKYKNQYRAAAYLGAYYGHLLKDLTPTPVDGIIPVPLHRARQRQRGYNQSAWLAKGIAQATGWPCYPHWLARRVNTTTQTNKSRSERMTNVANAFQLTDAADVQGKHLLLVDDLVTTGATLKACANVFEGHQHHISVAVLAMAI